MPEQARRKGAHWLYRILTLIYRLFVLTAAIFAIYMIAVFPAWSSEVRKFPLPCWVKYPTTALPALETTATSSVLDAKFKSLHAIVEVRLGNQWFHWLGMFYLLVSVLLGTLIVGQIRLVVGSLAQGDVFSRTNARRLRWLGVALIVGAFLGPVYIIAMTMLAMRGITVGGAPVIPDWRAILDWEPFVSAWIVLILSEVFRQGAELHEDQSLTV